MLTSTKSQVSNCVGVVLGICLDHKLEGPAQTFLFKASSEIFDPNNFQARHHRKIEFDLKSMKKEFLSFPQSRPRAIFRK